MSNFIYYTPASAITLAGDVTGPGNANTVVKIQGNAGSIPIAATGNILTWATATTAPGITHTAAVSGAGANMTITPQTATSTGTSGSVIIALGVPASGATEATFSITRGGTPYLKTQGLIGAATTNVALYGNVTPSATNFLLQGAINNASAQLNSSNSTALCLGGNAYLTLNASDILLGYTSLAYAAAIAAPIFHQLDNTTNSATAAALIIQAANATGTTATGGNLILKSGTGTSTNGSILIQSGGTTKLKVSPTTLTSTCQTTTNSYDGYTTHSEVVSTSLLTTTTGANTIQTIATVTNSVMLIDCTITGVSYSAGVAVNCCSGKLSMTIINANDVLTLSTLTVNQFFSNIAGVVSANLVITNSNTNVIVTVAGAAATSIQWSAITNYIITTII